MSEPFSPFFSQQYNDIYFSPDDPEAEKQFVFIEANRVAERAAAAETFTVAELGFGFGLNYALTVHAAATADSLRKLRFFSVEESLPEETAAKALAEKLKICQREFEDFWQPSSATRRGPPLPEVWSGDVLSFLQQATFFADAWYFDGFSPAKNPAMWSAEVFALAFERTAAGGTFSTYSAAGWVKRNLEAAGFHVSKVPGFGTKREMLVGYKAAAVAPAGSEHQKAPAPTPGNRA